MFGVKGVSNVLGDAATALRNKATGVREITAEERFAGSWREMRASEGDEAGTLAEFAASVSRRNPGPYYSTPTYRIRRHLPDGEQALIGVSALLGVSAVGLLGAQAISATRR